MDWKFSLVKRPFWSDFSYSLSEFLTQKPKLSSAFKMLGKNVRIVQKLAHSSGLRHTRLMSSAEPRTVTLIPGDGIGPEISYAVQRFEKIQFND